MKIYGSLIIILLLGSLLAFAYSNRNLGSDPWKPAQLLAPGKLAESISKNTEDMPVIFNIGPSGAIKGSVEIGSTQEEENLARLKTELSKLPKNKAVVIYCGCCPFNKCPNIRPAFLMLEEMKFTNGKLLDLPQNLKTDWIDKNYPMQN